MPWTWTAKASSAARRNFGSKSALGAAAVVAGLVGSGREEDQSQGQAIYVGSKSVGQWSTDRAGRLVVQIEAEHLTEDRQRAVIDAVAKALWP